DSVSNSPNVWLVPLDEFRDAPYLSGTKNSRVRETINGESMKKSLLLSTAVLALGLAFTVTANAGVSGTLGASYASDTNGGSGDLWNINGSLTGMVASNWGLEATAGYHSLGVGCGSNLYFWNVGG